jgi:hypothetical protein
METISEEKSINEISEIIRQINQSWKEGHTERLKNYFHERMIIVSPDLKILGEGRDVCIKSYSDFLTQAKVKKYNESKPDVLVWGNTAVALYKYNVNWEMSGKSYEESGKDLFIFTFEGGKWLAVWRKLIPDEK